MKCGRRGMMLFEIIVATVMIAIMITITIQLMVALGKQRRTMVRRARAIQTAANVMERLAAEGWDHVTPEASVRYQPLIDSADLPVANLDIQVVEDDDAWPAKRVTVIVSWRGGLAPVASKVRLATWAYPKKASLP